MSPTGGRLAQEAMLKATSPPKAHRVEMEGLAETSSAESQRRRIRWTLDLQELFKVGVRLRKTVKLVVSLMEARAVQKASTRFPKSRWRKTPISCLIHSSGT